MKKIWLALVLVMMPAFAIADTMDKYMEMLRSDFRTTKTRVLTEGLKLTEAEGQKFWPIQREYETELAKIGDQRLQLIKDYAAHYDSLSPAMARQLTDRAFKLESSRLSLLKKYTDKESKAVSPMVAARFAQIEATVNAMIDLQIRANLPLVP